MSQEKMERSTQGEQKKKRKRLNDDANDATDATTSTDISKEDLNENNLSKRKLKKKKLTEAEIAKKREKEDRAMQMAHRYLNKWKYSRNDWKFEKLKQIWLIDNLLSTHCISNEIFPVVLEYFEECKGMARETLVQKAMAVIKKAENEMDEEDKRVAMKTIAYKRARQVLQTLHSKE